MPKKGLTIRCRSCKILNVRRELITPARQIEKQAKHSLLVFPRMSERPLIIGQFSGVGTGGSIALFTALQQDGAMLSLLRKYESRVERASVTPVSTKPKPSEAGSVWKGRRRERMRSFTGAYGNRESGVERASSDVTQKGCGQSCIGAGPLCRNRHRPVTLN